MVEQLKGDKLILGKANHFEKQLDDLIEKQVSLKEDEQFLMKKVKVAQKKVDTSQSNHSKTIEPAFGGMSYGGAPSGSKTVGKNEVRGANGLTA